MSKFTTTIIDANAAREMDHPPNYENIIFVQGKISAAEQVIVTKWAILE